MSDTPAAEPADEHEPETPATGEHPHTVPDLDTVQARIDEAHDAEDHLETVMPDGIQPDDDAYEGASGPTEGDVAETDASVETDDERDARADRQPVAEQVQEDVTGTEDDAERAQGSGRS